MAQFHIGEPCCVMDGAIPRDTGHGECKGLRNTVCARMGSAFFRPQWADVAQHITEVEPKVTNDELHTCEMHMRRCQKGEFIAALNRIRGGLGHTRLCHDAYNAYCTPAVVKALAAARKFPYAD